MEKKTVYLPLKDGNSEISVSYWERDTHIVDVKEESGYFFTPEQLNEYTANVIKQASVEFANWIAYIKKHGGVKPLQEALIQYKLKSTEELFNKYLEMSK